MDRGITPPLITAAFSPFLRRPIIATITAAAGFSQTLLPILCRCPVLKNGLPLDRVQLVAGPRHAAPRQPFDDDGM